MTRAVHSHTSQTALPQKEKETQVTPLAARITIVALGAIGALAILATTPLPEAAILGAAIFIVSLLIANSEIAPFSHQHRVHYYEGLSPLIMRKIFRPSPLFHQSIAAHIPLREPSWISSAPRFEEHFRMVPIQRAHHHREESAQQSPFIPVAVRHPLSPLFDSSRAPVGERGVHR